MAGGPQRAGDRGRRFELSVSHDLKSDGYWVTKSGGSKTVADLIAVKPGEILFIQCKAGDVTRGSKGTISPAEREGLFVLSCALIEGKAIVAYQAKVGRRFETRYRQLVGAGPGDYRPWVPDQVI